MTVEIKLSEIGGQEIIFADLVEKHIAKLHAFAKSIGQPRPTASPMIEMAVARVQEKGKPDTYVPNYTIIDDTPAPPPPLNLDDRKNQVHQKLIIAEHEAKDKVMPPRKKRLLSMMYEQAIAKLEQDRTVEEQSNLDTFLDINKKWVDIGLIAAKAEAAIDDLTDDTINDWQLPDFG